MTALFSSPKKPKPQKSAADLEQERKAEVAAKKALGGLTLASTNKTTMLSQKAPQSSNQATKTTLGA